MPLGFKSTGCFLLSTEPSLRRTIVPSAFVPVRNFISLPIEWKRPERRFFNDPIKTGDGTTSLKLDMSKAPIEIENSKEYEKADELVKRMFTFNFLGRRYAVHRATSEMVDTVKNHEYDSKSLEVQIATKTAKIRSLMEPFKETPWENRMKSQLNHNIQKRRRYLRNLRKHDYKRYEWLLEKLDLIYTPVPEFKEYVERKKSIRRLANIYCEEFKQKKLDEYRRQLDNKKENFLREKVDKLKWIRREEIDCGVNPTVSEIDIEKAVDQLESHLEQLRLKPIVKDDTRNILIDV